MKQEFIEKLIKIAKRDCFYDDEEDKTVYDYSGSNVDDAFSIGESAGEVLLVREVLTEMNIKLYE